MNALLLIWLLEGPIAQTVLLALIVRRRLHRRGMYRAFSAYTLYSLLVTVLSLLQLNRPAQYAMMFWSTECIYGVLALLSLNEVFSRTFFLDYKERPWLRLVFPATVTTICLGLVAWWRFVYTKPNGDHIGIPVSILIGFTQGVHSIEGILLVLFLAFWLVFNPGWNRYDHGILLGFGISGVVTMTADLYRLNPGRGYQLWDQYAPGIAYIFVTLLWLYFFWPPPKPEPKPARRFHAVLEQTRRDNAMMKAIHEWLNRQG